MSSAPKHIPPQTQDRHPGREHEMDPAPQYRPKFPGVGKLKDKVAIVTGGDSGIGRSVCVHFANEGADVVCAYLNEHEDAKVTKEEVEKLGRKCLLIATDLGFKENCQEVVDKTIAEFGKIDTLVNNAAQQQSYDFPEELPADELERTFRTNVFGYYYLTQCALPKMKEGSTIINTCSVVAYKGNPSLMDYAGTRGAAVAFTRSLAAQQSPKGIRVNGVAPGPIWTPFIPSANFDEDSVEDFGANTPLGRAGQPNELAPAYVYLACEESSYVAGQMIHVNGGRVIAS